MIMPESFKRNPEEEKWKEVTQWRTENKDWLELSFSIALCVVDEMERTGITQKELAKRMQVSPQQVSKILKGSENLTLETICKLNSVLGIQLITVTSSEDLAGEDLPKYTFEVTEFGNVPINEPLGMYYIPLDKQPLERKKRKRKRKGDSVED